MCRGPHSGQESVIPQKPYRKVLTATQGYAPPRSGAYSQGTRPEQEEGSLALGEAAARGPTSSSGPLKKGLLTQRRGHPPPARVAGVSLVSGVWEGAVGTVRGLKAQGRASTLLCAGPWGGRTQSSGGARSLETVQPTRPRGQRSRPAAPRCPAPNLSFPKPTGDPPAPLTTFFPARKSTEQLGGGERLREETPGGGRCTRGTVYARVRGGAARGKMATARAGPAGRGCRGPGMPPPPGWPPGRAAAAAGLQAGVGPGEGAPGA